MLLIDVEIKNESIGGRYNTGSNKIYENNHQMRGKLDWIMKIMIDYLDYTFEIGSDTNDNIFGIANNKHIKKEDIEEHNELMVDKFIELTDIFEKYLLVTYQPKYIQFLFFYLCSNDRLSSDIVKTFLTILIDNITLEDTNKIIRINSTNYLSSMIARAKFIKFSIVEATVKFLMEFLIKYTDQFTQQQHGNLSNHKNKKSHMKELSNNNKSNKDISSLSCLNNGKETTAFDFLSVEFANNMKKYKMLNELLSPSTGFCILKEKLEQHKIFYYTAMAIMYIYSYRMDDFVKNNSIDKLNEFIDLLQKYDDKLVTLNIIPTRILKKFHDISSKIPKQHHEFIIKLENELEKDSIKSKSNRPKLMEEYYPFDAHFLNFSKAKFINMYLFDREVGIGRNGLSDEIDSLITFEDLNTLSNPNEDSNSNLIVIKENHDDKVEDIKDIKGMKDIKGIKGIKHINDDQISDNSSHLSKYETEASAENFKIRKQNSLLRKRKGVDINDNSMKSLKKVKRNGV